MLALGLALGPGFDWGWHSTAWSYWGPVVRGFLARVGHGLACRALLQALRGLQSLATQGRFGRDMNNKNKTFFEKGYRQAEGETD